MKKYDFSDKKLNRDLLISNIFLTLVCISPILYTIIEHHSDTHLIKCIIMTAIMVGVIAFSWASYFGIMSWSTDADVDSENTGEKNAD